MQISRHCSHFRFARFCAAASLAILFAGQAHGRVFVVKNTQDVTDEKSLRGAIIAANRLGGNHTILLARGTYRLTLVGAGEDAAFSGDLDLTAGNLAIVGVSAERVIIDGSGAGDRVFHVLPGARLTLREVTITGGATHLRDNRGGAILNAGRLDMTRCIVQANHTTSPTRPPKTPSEFDGRGGGIFSSGNLTMESCLITGNFTADGAGGMRANRPAPDELINSSNGSDGAGIFNTGSARINGCIIADNFTGAGGTGGFAAGDDQQPGRTAPGGNGGNGAGVFNAGTMEIHYSTIGNNASAPGGTGGYSGVYPVGGGAGGMGGNGAGLFNSGSLTLNACTVSGNNTGSGGWGGGGYCTPWSDDPFAFFFCAGNGSGGNGGDGAAIFNSGDLKLLNSTISSNANGSGGSGAGSGGYAGVCNEGTLALTHCTVTGNSGGDGGWHYSWFNESIQGAGGDGGVVNRATRADAVVGNCLIAQNRAGAGGIATSGSIFTNGSYLIFIRFAVPDLAGDFTTQGYNLIGASDGSTGFTHSLNGDLVGSATVPLNPLLGPLQDNGGPTLTHALLPGSPAIDQGTSSGLNRDQRGRRRPLDFPSIPNPPGGDGSDIGAFELGPRGHNASRDNDRDDWRAER